MTLQILELPEDPRQRGEAHGEALREEANTLYQAHLAQLASQPAFAACGITDDASYQAYAARFRPHAEAYAPHLWAELEGIAAGARMTVNQVLAQNLYLESYDAAHPAAPAVLGGCTAWAHRRGHRGAVAEQSAMVGQTYDMSSIYEPAGFVL